MMRATFGLAVLLVVAATTQVKALPIVFSDDFNDETPGLNHTFADNWTVTGGTVDVIGEGTSWNFFPGEGYGLYVDMDGSTGNAGLMTSDPLWLESGIYALSYDLAGNRRGSQNDAVTVQVQLGDLVNTTRSLTYDTDFTTFEDTFVVESADDYYISFEGAGGDNIGMLLDNVQLEFLDEVHSAVVPEAASILGWGLLGITFGGIAWFRRRRAA